MEHVTLQDGKFIQVYVKDEPYLMSAPENRFHGDMLEDLLKELKIEYSTFTKGTRQLPEAEGEDYHMVGAGAIMDVSPTSYLLTGESFDYGLKPNQEHLDDVKPHIPDGIELKVSNFTP